ESLGGRQSVAVKVNVVQALGVGYDDGLCALLSVELALLGVVEVGGWRLGLDGERARAVVKADLCVFPVVEAGRLVLELRGVERLPPFGRGVLVDVAYELLVRVLDPDARHRYWDVSAREHRKLGPGRGDTDAGYLIAADQSRVGDHQPGA